MRVPFYSEKAFFQISFRNKRTPLRVPFYCGKPCQTQTRRRLHAGHGSGLDQADLAFLRTSFSLMRADLPERLRR
ncbi:Uncharacterised protein [Bordetella pertussis]|nr:Uncharacterised protein [Bordetella pertussis]CFW40231.1 Uncharacterised protein [Bordetella pertussis]